MHSLQLLCGLLCDETVWADIPGRLANVAETRIVTFPDCKSIEAMADRALRGAPHRFALAGHSMGGRVALEIWRRAPERVTALALLNSGAHPSHDNERKVRGMLLQIARTRGMAALADQWLPPMLRASHPRTAEVLPALSRMVQRATPASFADQTAALMQRPDARPLLATIRVPTLLLSGTEETWPAMTQQSEMQRAIPHARCVEIAGAGHMAPAERPDAVARALHMWLRTCPAD